MYNPETPSFLIVCITQSNGPLKWPSLLVCNRTLTVSNLSDPASQYIYVLSRDYNSKGGSKHTDGRLKSHSATVSLYIQYMAHR